MLGKKLSEKLVITSPHLHGELQTFLVFSQHPKWVITLIYVTNQWNEHSIACLVMYTSKGQKVGIEGLRYWKSM